MFIAKRQSSTPHFHQIRDLTAKNKEHIALGIGLVLGVAALLACVCYLVYVIRRRWARLEQEKERTFCEGSKTTKEDTESRTRGISIDLPFSALPGRSILSRISSIRSKQSNTRSHSVAYSFLQPSTSFRIPSRDVVEAADSDIPPTVPPKEPGSIAQRRNSEIGPLPTFLQRNQSTYHRHPVHPNPIGSPISSVSSTTEWARMSNGSVVSPVSDMRRAKSEASSRLERQTDKYSVTESPKTIRPGHIATCIPQMTPASPAAVSTMSPSRTFRSPTDMVTAMEVLMETNPTAPASSPVPPPIAELAPSTPRYPPPQMSLPSPPLSSPQQEETPLLRRQSPPPMAARTASSIAYTDGDTETRYSSDEEASTFDTNMSLKFKPSEYLLPPVLPPLSPQTTFSMSSSRSNSRPASFQRPPFGR